MSRPKKPRPPASPRPWRAVLLAVDPGSKRSGWSIWVGGLVHRSGECRLSISEIAQVVRAAQWYGGEYDMPCVLVTERPFMQKRGKAHGASDHAHKLWRDVWEDCGCVKKRVVRVYPSVWRSTVLGPGHGNMPRDKVRPVEQRKALDLLTNYGYGPQPDGAAMGPDQAPAIVIGRWATHAGEVGASLPAKLRRVA